MGIGSQCRGGEAKNEGGAPGVKANVMCGGTANRTVILVPHGGNTGNANRVTVG
jgi:hypothetical protein